MSTPVVFDCMVFLQAATSAQGPAAACVGLVEQGEVTLVLSRPILAEVREVLYRPRVRRKFPHLTDDRIEDFLHRIEVLGSLYELVPRVFQYPRDPDDEPYVNLAIASNARYLVTRDKDLLDLTADGAFRQNAPNLTILNPAGFLEVLSWDRQRAEEPERKRGMEI